MIVPFASPVPDHRCGRRAPKRVRPTLLVAMTCLMGQMPSVHGQSLAEVARREAQRRSAVKSPGPVYTNDAVVQAPSEVAPAGKSAPASSTPASPVPGAKAERSDESSKPEVNADPESLPKAREKRDEQYWLTRAADLRTRIDRLRSDGAGLEARSALLAGELESLNDPARKKAIARDRDEALAVLGRLRQDISSLQEEQRAFFEHARRANVPAAWLR